MVDDSHDKKTQGIMGPALATLGGAFAGLLLAADTLPMPNSDVVSPDLDIAKASRDEYAGAAAHRMEQLALVGAGAGLLARAEAERRSRRKNNSKGLEY
ncbi:MAG: hypothetical protein EBR02_09335 [Alphaproteobacteria bacterium]|nr:hypothetical protein [Alphaproteobacteria bacterium]